MVNVCIISVNTKLYEATRSFHGNEVGPVFEIFCLDETYYLRFISLCTPYLKKTSRNLTVLYSGWLNCSKLNNAIEQHNSFTAHSSRIFIIYKKSINHLCMTKQFNVFKLDLLLSSFSHWSAITSLYPQSFNKTVFIPLPNAHLSEFYISKDRFH